MNRFGPTSEDIARLRGDHLRLVRERIKQQQRIAQLEEQLSRVDLLASGLADLCLDKGLVTFDELTAHLKRLELSRAAAAAKAATGSLAPQPSSKPVPSPRTVRERIARRSRLARTKRKPRS